MAAPDALQATALIFHVPVARPAKVVVPVGPLIICVWVVDPELTVTEIELTVPTTGGTIVLDSLPEEAPE